jgi:GNAT superfamily N-acetyltransferase
MTTDRDEDLNYQIAALDCCTSAAETYSSWIQETWVREPICDWLESGSPLGTLGDVTMPIVYAAVARGDRILGAAAIVLDEMLDRPRWNPWLGLVYVDPMYREAGIGIALVDSLVQASERAGINELYLFCPPRLEHLYRRFNFKPIETREYDGVYAVTMSRRTETSNSDRGSG